MTLGCFPRADPSQPIPTEFIGAPTKAQRLVVVLPGRGDDVAALRNSGIVQAVQTAWPDADIVLTGLALDYYMQGGVDRKLHDEVVVPARRRGYEQVWLVGASLGGMGAIMYDRAYPNDVTGLVLLAPWLGEKPVLTSVRQAGGLAAWQAPPQPAVLTAENFGFELWRHAQSWLRDPVAARRVWVAYGKKDSLRDAISMLTPALAPSHVLVREGGHDWPVWSSATREVLVQIDKENPR